MVLASAPKGDIIHGVKFESLNPIVDERGFLMELMRESSELLPKFGQCYMSVTYPGVIRAWHWHKKQADNFYVLKGMAKIGLYDRREKSETYQSLNEFVIGEQSPAVIHIPVEVLHGFKAIGNTPCLLLNIVTEMYDPKNPDEERVPWDDPSIPYDWNATVNK